MIRNAQVLFADKALEHQYKIMTKPYQELAIRDLGVLLSELGALERFWKSTVADVRNFEGNAAAERAKSIRLLPVRHRLEEVKSFRDDKEREWKRNIWDRYHVTATHMGLGEKIVSAWDTYKSIKKREDLRYRYISCYNLTKDQRVEYFRDYMLISELGRFSKWMYASFLMDETRYIGHDDYKRARIGLYICTAAYIILTSAYILLFGIENGAVKTNKAIAGF